MSEPVYVVRLTVAQRERLMMSTMVTFSESTEALHRKLEAARPEHPERQAALELLYAIAIAIDWPQASLNGYREFIKALAHVRSLEPKP